MVTKRDLFRQIIQRRTAGKSSAGQFFEGSQRFGSGFSQEFATFQETLPRETIEQIERGVTTRAEAREVGLSPAQLRETRARVQILGITEPQRQIAEFRKQGLDPIIREGQIRGFSDIRAGVDIPIESLGFIAESRLQGLERSGLITFQPKVIPRPPSTVTVAPTFLEQLERTFIESTPNIKFVPRDIENIIGFVSGTEKVVRGKLSGQLAQLRDIEGKRLFTPTQAEKLADITVEVIEGFGTGIVAGKVFTLARGGFLAALPIAVKESTKFKKVIQVADVVGLVGLGTLEAKRIAKVNKEQGTDAAIIELIGLVSFGKGFSKTGLKADPQAEAEFRKFAKDLTDFSAKGKRGERFTALGKKIKEEKSPFAELEQVSKKDFEKAEALVGELELKLLNEKTLEAQLKILAEIKGRLKTKVAKENFDKLVLRFIEKDILKLPTIEIAPGVTAKVPFLPGKQPIKPTIKVPISKAQARNLERVKLNLERNKARVEQSKKTLGERIVERQEQLKEINQKIDVINKQIDKQKDKISSLVKQKASQKTIQKERQKLQSLLKTRQGIRQPLAQRGLLKQRQLERQKLLLKQRQVSRLKLQSLLKGKAKLKKPGVPGVPIPFSKGKKKVKKKPSKEKVGSPFEIFVRKKGKDIRVGTAKTKPLARKKLKKRLDTTLRASGFITDNKGARLKPKVSPGFRISKVDPFRIVERKEKRLDTKTEVKSIQKARKLKSSQMIKVRREKK